MDEVTVKNRVPTEALAVYQGEHFRGNSRIPSTGLARLLRALVIGFAFAAPAIPPHALAQLPVGGFFGVERIEEKLGDQVEARVRNSVEFATEQNIQENIEDSIEETIEQTVDATVEDSIDDVVANTIDQRLEQDLEDSIVAGVEDGVEAGIEDAVQSAVENSVEDDLVASVEADVEEGVEASVEASVEAGVEDAVEEAVEAGLSDSIEDAVEDSVQVAVEDAAEQAAEDAVAGNIEASVEASVEDAVEESVASTVEGTVEDSVEASLESSVEAAVEESVAQAVEDSVEEAVAATVEDDVEAGVEDSVEAAIEDDVDQRVMLAIEDRLELEIDEIVDNLESDLEIDEGRILKEQWLVMAEPEAFGELSVKGYLFDTVTELPALGLRLAEVAAPSSFDIRDVRNGVFDVVGKDRAEVDLNHFYTAGAPITSGDGGVVPRSAMPLPTDLDDLDVRVGMIDSLVDTSHPALQRSRIESRSFAPRGAAAPNFHGTAIASIIAANSDEYRGLAPNAQLFAASVFELDKERGEIASTVSLIRALDWLLASDVDVVNISLAGPPNRLLEKALERAAEQKVVVMAAAGNGGPVARPMYPAAYDSVVAVTAVDATQQVFRLANRGDYLALAAPGVDLRHARAGGGYATSSGTSFAVPFAVTAAARLSRLAPQTDIITALLESALDIGPPGRDSIYGYGLLSLGAI
ncbi:MAG: S8 family serine peptidase [Halieaceae bacterium]|jgi:hypothetical protein|nr:S8 family serine peptidase [Halieaceae bacterium]